MTPKLRNGENLPETGDLLQKTGGRCVVDSAFTKGKYGFLIKYSQGNIYRGSDENKFSLRRQETTARKASEWIMREFQGTFARMKEIFLYEEHGERNILFLGTVLLFILRKRLAVINKILHSYMPHTSVEENTFIEKHFFPWISFRCTAERYAYADICGTFALAAK